jgi:hypothetical protein
MQARFLSPQAIRVRTEVIWGDDCIDRDCDICAEHAPDEPPAHEHRPIAHAALFDDDHVIEGDPFEALARWEVAATGAPHELNCRSCGAPVAVGAIKGAHAGFLYDTETLLPEPGDVYAWPAHDTGACADERCGGLHLFAVLSEHEHSDLGPVAQFVVMGEYVEVTLGCSR